MKFSRIPEIIARIKSGGMVVVVDDEDRENEGDLVMAAEKVTPDAVNFMAKHGRGLICVPLHAKKLQELGLKPMVEKNSDRLDTAFTVSVDCKDGTTTGISAYDRALTIKALISSGTKPEDLACPGHVFPLMAKSGGVLRRAGHTETAVDLARLSGLYPAGVICEIMNDDGTMARLPELFDFSRKFDLLVCTVADLIEYRRKTEKLINRVVKTELPTPYGNFDLILYGTLVDESYHLALVMGKISGERPVLVRVHSECLTGDVFHSKRCDCGTQLVMALKQISKAGEGVFVYMRQEGRGIGLANKLRAYVLQEQGKDTVEANEELGFPADLRDYGIGAQILVDLGVRKVRLMTNNPKKVVGLEGYGLEIVERVSIEVEPHEHNVKYLKTKKEKLGHMLNIKIEN